MCCLRHHTLETQDRSQSYYSVNITQVTITAYLAEKSGNSNISSVKGDDMVSVELLGRRTAVVDTDPVADIAKKPPFDAAAAWTEV